MEDIADTLIFEVKKDIAERYFGFRKRIEDDSAAYHEEIDDAALFLETHVGFDLLRIYSLLRDDTHIRRFCKLTKLGKPLFFDSYINNSPTIRKKLFAGQKVRGFFRKSRFTNMFHDTYKNLRNSIEEYRKRFAALTEEHDTIKEEIAIFYKKNDISGIMYFLRSLEGTNGTSGPMAGSIDQGGAIRMEEKMRLHPPAPANQFLPVLHTIPEPSSIKPELNKIIENAYAQQGDFDIKNLQ